MAGFTAPAVMQRLNVDLTPMYFELDGDFPNHEANPIEPENLKALQKKVKKEKADIGLAFDGDADRCFLIDENGDLVNPSALTCLIAARELKANPGSTIIYNLISSKAVSEVITEKGGNALRSRVGHSYIKTLMAESGAVFGGEHSGHFYFEDFWGADSGMLAALYALAELMATPKSLSTLLEPYIRYVSSGEINSKVKDANKSIQLVKDKYQDNYQIDELDGLTVTAENWWFNLRASNTEPLLRLNVEAENDIADSKLAAEGKKRIEWAARNMPVLAQIKERFAKEKPFTGVRIAACMHVTTETANLMLALKAGGAELALCASNPLSTQDDTAAALVHEYGISVFARNAVDRDGYYGHLNSALDIKPQLVFDDGCDLVNVVHTTRTELIDGVMAGCEETTTGVIRLSQMAKDGALKFPMIAVNDTDTKHMFDNRYGTGQSTFDAIFRATN